MRPSSGVSKPAIMRKVVVLPQPDGPSSAKNSPASIASSTPSTARLMPSKLLLRRARRTAAARPASFTRGQPAGATHAPGSPAHQAGDGRVDTALVAEHPVVQLAPDQAKQPKTEIWS